MKHLCTVKRQCSVCKRNYARKYRADGRYKEQEKEYAQKIRLWRMNTAKSKVMIEVRAKRIKRPDSFRCVDCAKRAEVYDHRDYAKPLVVAPVCRSCNKKRGPGLNKI